MEQIYTHRTDYCIQCTSLAHRHSITSNPTLWFGNNYFQIITLFSFFCHTCQPVVPWKVLHPLAQVSMSSHDYVAIVWDPQLLLGRTINHTRTMRIPLHQGICNILVILVQRKPTQNMYKFGFIFIMIITLHFTQILVMIAHPSLVVVQLTAHSLVVVILRNHCQASLW